jgi:hypothetical protein
MTYQELLLRYRDKHGALVKPDQGWTSLSANLWLAYSMGRKRGFTDLGTYADKPGDHGYWPARAFDLGRNNRFYNKGWNYLVARNLALLYVEHHKALNIDYVILGQRIWSRKYPYWHAFTRDTSHMWHIHVSGIDPKGS